MASPTPKGDRSPRKERKPYNQLEVIEHLRVIIRGELVIAMLEVERVKIDVEAIPSLDRREAIINRAIAERENEVAAAIGRLDEYAAN